MNSINLLVIIQSFLWCSYSLSAPNLLVYQGLSCSAPVQNLNIPIRINGCGPIGKNIVAQGVNEFLNAIGPKFLNCCNEHDKCYSYCTNSWSSFDKCNNDFYECMRKACNDVPADNSSANTNTWTKLKLFVTNVVGIITQSTCLAKAKIFKTAVDGSIGKDVFYKNQKEYCKCPSRMLR